jgi:tRNA-guanine family transglycosylase
MRSPNASTSASAKSPCDKDFHRRGATFSIESIGNTRARSGRLTIGEKTVTTPVLWLGHSLKSRVRVTHEVEPLGGPLPILVNYAELRNNSVALGKSRNRGLGGLMAHSGPILLDSGGYQFQKRRTIDLRPESLAAFYDQCGADIAVALDHPLSPALSRTTNMRRWRRSLENLAAMRRTTAPYVLMPVVHGYTISQIRRNCEQVGVLIANPCIIGIGSMVPLLKASHIGGRFRYRRGNGSLGNHVDFIADAIETVREMFPTSMLHVFGAGGVPTALALFAAGADSCDSAAWRLKASYGAIQLPGTSDRFLRKRRNSIRTRRVVDAKDVAAIGECECSACGPIRTVAARRALLDSSFSARAAHNAHVLISEIDSFRTAIRSEHDFEWLAARLADTHRLGRLIKLRPGL